MHYIRGVRIRTVVRVVACLLQLASTNPFPLHSSASNNGFETSATEFDDLSTNERPPIPPMPSDLFRKMAQSQLEVLANALNRPENSSESKVESMALYLPQENVFTGQLEFTPVVVYPDPKSERVFISYDAGSGKAPTLPRALTKLPGFSHAATLLPGYPMISSSGDCDPDVGSVEEVMCDPRFKYGPPALSVPLLSGPQTVGVLLVSGMTEPTKKQFWSENDRRQVSSAAQSLSMALTMDNERSILREQNQMFKDSLSDSLHQVKNPLQALRTYGKILQRHMADADSFRGDDMSSPQLLELVERLMTQSERVVDLMIPMDTLVNSFDQPGPYILAPAEKEPQPQPLVLWERRRKVETVSTPTNKTFEFDVNKIENNTELIGSLFLPRTINTTSRSDDSRKKQKVKTKLEPNQSSNAHTTVGDVETEMVFVNDILEPIISAFEAIASERNIDLKVVEMDPELPGVIAAPKSLQEAVANLLDNALKYVILPKSDSPFTSNPSPKVDIRILANQDPVGVTVLVEDNGPGISETDAEQIFQRGFRGEATRSVQGTGIGLDISQALVQRMGGDLQLASHEDYPQCLDGTVMALTLYRAIS
ncbi:unnamed protein product [Cylindrotheca closterium]|uniref:histidine kinase n=1 Tax=Cylindrotheca closterium TaxID=2856 RepID=A0AAD2JPA4_9STRA|nr:unnamed protein product [Cylindrotheca closterium]